MICHCGNEIDPDPPGIVTAGGWCAPSELLHDDIPRTPVCSDCDARLLMMMTIGIDPGHNGENLKVSRGGIRYR